MCDEPSAVVSLPDGNIMVFEDDGREMISIHQVAEDAKGLILERGDDSDSFPPLAVSDIEAAAIGRNGEVILYCWFAMMVRKRRRERVMFLLVLGSWSNMSRAKEKCYDSNL